MIIIILLGTDHPIKFINADEMRRISEEQSTGAMGIPPKMRVTIQRLRIIYLQLINYLISYSGLRIAPFEMSAIARNHIHLYSLHQALPKILSTRVYRIYS